MSKKTKTDRDRTHLLPRFLAYLQVGLYNILWSMSENTILNHRGRENGPQTYPNPKSRQQMDDSQRP